MPFSPKNPFSTGVTFAGVLIFTMFKEAYEDYYRHKQDNFENKKKVFVFDKENSYFNPVESKNIRVGDIVMIKDGDFFPADLLFISSHDLHGHAYVNTMNLDGESNLKQKTASDITQKIKSTDDLANFSADL